MKLVLCTECWDVFKLAMEPRSCKCGLCSGHYKDRLNAVYSGEEAMPLGFANGSLMLAMGEQPKEGMGKEFTAFVIPEICPTMEYQEPSDE